MNSIRSLLSETKLDKTDAKVILGFLCQSLLGWPRSSLISRDQEQLDQRFINAWRDLEQRRASGEPVAYLIGSKGFHDIELTVNSHTLIPRPETELLVNWAIDHIESLIKDSHSSFKNDSALSPFRILDLGTGSGAIALAIANHFFKKSSSGELSIEIVATDIDPKTLEVAKRNGIQLGLNDYVSFKLSSWYDDLPTATPFNLILSNPPYIRQNDIHLQQGDLRFEPRQALTDEADGLSAYRTILGECDRFLKPLGWLVVEHGYDQKSETQNLFKQKGFLQIQTLDDLAGIERVTLGQLPAVP